MEIRAPVPGLGRLYGSLDTGYPVCPQSLDSRSECECLLGGDDSDCLQYCFSRVPLEDCGMPQPLESLLQLCIERLNQDRVDKSSSQG